MQPKKLGKIVSNSTVHRTTPKTGFTWGKVYESKSQTASAIAAYQGALRLRPTFPEAARALSTDSAGHVFMTGQVTDPIGNYFTAVQYLQN